MTFWESDQWFTYEMATKDRPGTRAALLADADWQTRVVDLRQPVETLWRDVRRSYHSLVNKLEKDPAFSVAEVESATLFLEMCRPLHLREAKRDTRPILSWLVQGDWIDARTARCFIASWEGRSVGFAFIAVHGRWAYYFSAASTVPNVQHVIQWRAILALKMAGVECYELGWMDRPGDHEKDRQIAFFKRGFGGFDVPVRLSGRKEMLQ